MSLLVCVHEEHLYLSTALVGTDVFLASETRDNNRLANRKLSKLTPPDVLTVEMGVKQGCVMTCGTSII